MTLEQILFIVVCGALIILSCLGSWARKCESNKTLQLEIDNDDYRRGYNKAMDMLSHDVSDCAVTNVLAYDMKVSSNFKAGVIRAIKQGK